NLVALRSLGVTAGKEEKPEHIEERVLKLRRYILGLALTVLTNRDHQQFNLREGCLLRIRTSSSWKAVPFEGNPTDVPVDSDKALAFAKKTAQDFDVKSFSKAFMFNKEKAESWLKLKKEERDKLRRKGPALR